jgi:hypothetical protein
MNREFSEENYRQWFKRVERYDRLMTKWENEIVSLLEEARLLISKEIS